ncbi:MAG: murein biosynthesis integral membrane protein MurJ [Fimbriimonadaceae bacterium]|nr:murein biosynthesis integral membrane protein MurJ [Fimbriimonadaceae bacterium]QYK57104.1 MAG: murein biosynthesis integral membrane protein MurJ [Fimbriimonadaceae bacterium]
MEASEAKPNVARAGWIMMASLVGSRVLGLVRDAVIAGLFGQSAERSAYVLAFGIPDLIFFLVAGGALSSAFIPVFSEYLHTGREEEAWKLFSVVVSVMSVLLIVVIAAAWVFAPQLAYLVAPGKPELHHLIVPISRVLLPAQFAFFIGGIMFGTLYARQVFTVPGLGPNVYNLGIITGGLVLSHFFTPGVLGLGWGALAGAFIGNIVIPLFVMRHLGAKFELTFDLKNEGARKVFRLMLPVVLGLSLPSVFALILNVFATFYKDESLVSALDNANRLVQAPLAIFGQSLAIAAFPALAQFFAQGRMDAFRDQVSSTLRTVVFLAVPATVLLITMPTAIIRLLLEHGAFGPEETARTIMVLRPFAIGIVAWCAQPVLMRAFFAVQQTLTPVVLGTIATAVFLGLCGLSYLLAWPPALLTLSGSIAAVVMAALLLVAIKRQVDGLDIRGILRTLGLALASTAPIAGLWFALDALVVQPHPGKLVAGSVLLLGGLTGAWAYYFAAKRLGMPETAYLDRALKRVGPKSS